MLDTISMAEKLKGDYQKVFEKADMYSTIASGNEDVNDEKMMNLYDLLLEAQSEDKPVAKIVGADIEAFCREYFEADKDEKMKWYVRLTGALYTACIWLTIIALIWVIFPEEGQTIQSLTLDIFPFLIGVSIGIVSTIIMKYLLEPIIFKSKKLKPLVFYFIILAVSFGSCILVFSVSVSANTELMNIPAIWLLAVCGGYVVIYLLVRSLWRYRTYGTIRKDTKENRARRKEEKKIKKNFNDEVSNESTDHLTAKFMAKRYARLNKRNIRRKHQELSFSEYAALIHKEESMNGKLNLIMACIFIALVIGSTVMQMVTTGFVDGLILGIILAVIETPIYLFFKSSNDTGSKHRLQIIAECERLGVSITEYANMKSIS